LLRTFSESGKVDADLIASYDLKLALAGDYIYKTRRAFIENFKPIFSKHYDFLVREPVEKVEITYKSDLREVDFELLLKKNLQRDLCCKERLPGCIAMIFCLL
jgi:DNA replication and repair protein RecF